MKKEIKHFEPWKFLLQSNSLRQNIIQTSMMSGVLPFSSLADVQIYENELATSLTFNIAFQHLLDNDNYLENIIYEKNSEVKGFTDPWFSVIDVSDVNDLSTLDIIEMRCKQSSLLLAISENYEDCSFFTMQPKNETLNYLSSKYKRDDIEPQTYEYASHRLRDNIMDLGRNEIYVSMSKNATPVLFDEILDIGVTIPVDRMVMPNLSNDEVIRTIIRNDFATMGSVQGQISNYDNITAYQSLFGSDYLLATNKGLYGIHIKRDEHGNVLKDANGNTFRVMNKIIFNNTVDIEDYYLVQFEDINGEHLVIITAKDGSKHLRVFIASYTAMAPIYGNHYLREIDYAVLDGIGVPTNEIGDIAQIRGCDRDVIAVLSEGFLNFSYFPHGFPSVDKWFLIESSEKQLPTPLINDKAILDVPWSGSNKIRYSETVQRDKNGRNFGNEEEYVAVNVVDSSTKKVGAVNTFIDNETTGIASIDDVVAYHNGTLLSKQKGSSNHDFYYGFIAPIKYERFPNVDTKHFAYAHKSTDANPVLSYNLYNRFSDLTISSLLPVAKREYFGNSNPFAKYIASNDWTVIKNNVNNCITSFPEVEKVYEYSYDLLDNSYVNNVCVSQILKFTSLDDLRNSIRGGRGPAGVIPSNVGFSSLYNTTFSYSEELRNAFLADIRATLGSQINDKLDYLLSIIEGSEISAKVDFSENKKYSPGGLSNENTNLMFESVKTDAKNAYYQKVGDLTAIENPKTYFNAASSRIDKYDIMTALYSYIMDYIEMNYVNKFRSSMNKVILGKGQKSQVSSFTVNGTTYEGGTQPYDALNYPAATSATVTSCNFARKVGNSYETETFAQWKQKIYKPVITNWCLASMDDWAENNTIVKEDCNDLKYTCTWRYTNNANTQDEINSMNRSIPTGSGKQNGYGCWYCSEQIDGVFDAFEWENPVPDSNSESSCAIRIPGTIFADPTTAPYGLNSSSQNTCAYAGELRKEVTITCKIIPKNMKCKFVDGNISFLWDHKTSAGIGTNTYYRYSYDIEWTIDTGSLKFPGSLKSRFVDAISRQLQVYKGKNVVPTSNGRIIISGNTYKGDGLDACISSFEKHENSSGTSEKSYTPPELPSLVNIAAETAINSYCSKFRNMLARYFFIGSDLPLLITSNSKKALVVDDSFFSGGNYTDNVPFNIGTSSSIVNEVCSKNGVDLEKIAAADYQNDRTYGYKSNVIDSSVISFINSSENLDLLKINQIEQFGTFNVSIKFSLDRYYEECPANMYTTFTEDGKTYYRVNDTAKPSDLSPFWEQGRPHYVDGVDATLNSDKRIGYVTFSYNVKYTYTYSSSNKTYTCAAHPVGLNSNTTIRLSGGAWHSSAKTGNKKCDTLEKLFARWFGEDNDVITEMTTSIGANYGLFVPTATFSSTPITEYATIGDSSTNKLYYYKNADSNNLDGQLVNVISEIKGRSGSLPLFNGTCYDVSINCEFNPSNNIIELYKPAKVNDQLRTNIYKIFSDDSLTNEKLVSIIQGSGVDIPANVDQFISAVKNVETKVTDEIQSFYRDESCLLPQSVPCSLSVTEKSLPITYGDATRAFLNDKESAFNHKVDQEMISVVETLFKLKHLYKDSDNQSVISNEDLITHCKNSQTNYATMHENILDEALVKINERSANIWCRFNIEDDLLPRRFNSIKTDSKVSFVGLSKDKRKVISFTDVSLARVIEEANFDHKKTHNILSDLQYDVSVLPSECERITPASSTADALVYWVKFDPEDEYPSNSQYKYPWIESGQLKGYFRYMNSKGEEIEIKHLVYTPTSNFILIALAGDSRIHRFNSDGLINDSGICHVLREGDEVAIYRTSCPAGQSVSCMMLSDRDEENHWRNRPADSTEGRDWDRTYILLLVYDGDTDYNNVERMRFDSLISEVESYCVYGLSNSFVNENLQAAYYQFSNQSLTDVVSEGDSIYLMTEDGLNLIDEGFSSLIDGNICKQFPITIETGDPIYTRYYVDDRYVLNAIGIPRNLKELYPYSSIDLKNFIPDMMSPDFVLIDIDMKNWTTKSGMSYILVCSNRGMHIINTSTYPKKLMYDDVAEIKRFYRDRVRDLIEHHELQKHYPESILSRFNTQKMRIKDVDIYDFHPFKVNGEYLPVTEQYGIVSDTTKGFVHNEKNSVIVNTDIIDATSTISDSISNPGVLFAAVSSPMVSYDSSWLKTQISTPIKGSDFYDYFYRTSTAENGVTVIKDILNLTNIPFIWRVNSDLTYDLFVNVLSTMTPYMNRVAGTNVNHRGGRLKVEKNEPSIRKNMNGVMVKSDPESMSTKVRIYIDLGYFRIGNIRDVEISGSSLPMYIYRDTDANDGFFDGVAIKTIWNGGSRILEDEHFGKFLMFEFSVWGTDEQSVHIYGEMKRD